MASYLDNLIATRNNIAARMADLSAQPKPDYSVDGEQLSWSAYFQMLSTQLESVEKAIQRAQAPFSRVSRGRA